MRHPPQPPGGVAVNRRADGKTCGLQGGPSTSSDSTIALPTEVLLPGAGQAITCSGSATCAAVFAAADSRLYAGCDDGVLAIATTCKDISTACSNCAAPGVLICSQKENCATRFWHHRPATDDWDRPHATQYYCNPDEFAQVIATYQPSVFPWKTLQANDLRTGIQVAGPATTGRSVTSPSGAVLPDLDPAANPSSSSSPAPGVIAGAAVGGGVVILALVGLVWFWRRRRATNSAQVLKSQGDEKPIPSFPTQSGFERGGDNMTDRRELLVSKEVDNTMEPSQSATYAPDYYHQETERTDTLGGLPSSEELRRMKPGAQFSGRGAPSVQTDFSETLTIGDTDEIDDIHLIGHGR